MKKLLTVILLIFPFFILAQNKNYTLTGKVGNINASAKAYLICRNDTSTVIDSIVIQNGRFKFKGTIIDPIQVTLALSYTGGGPRNRDCQFLFFYLESGDINISSPDSLVHATIKGSKVNSDNERLKDKIKAGDRKIAELGVEFKALPIDEQKNNEVKADYMKRLTAIIYGRNPIRLDFVRKNPDSFVSLDILKSMFGPNPDYATVAPLFTLFSSDIKNSVSGKKYAKVLEKRKLTAIGSLAPQFIQNNPDGKPIKLSSFLGKYVLVDFWASWCASCRAENPNVVKAYNKYHDKGLEILGVSLDDGNGKEAWLAAIQNDGLLWNQVSDLKGVKNEVAELYGIQAIPQNILLDKTGKIIGKNLRGEALNKKMKEIFN